MPVALEDQPRTTSGAKRRVNSAGLEVAGLGQRGDGLRALEVLGLEPDHVGESVWYISDSTSA